jgi:hypothetical protein
MPRPSHYSRFYHPHNSEWGVQIMKPLIIKFSPLPCILLDVNKNVKKDIRPTFNVWNL